MTSGWAYSIISRAVCARAGCGWASVAQWQSISLVMRRSLVVAKGSKFGRADLAAEEQTEYGEEPGSHRGMLE